MPTGEVARTFAQRIERLAGRYAAPVFPPHVTLIGSRVVDEEEVLDRAQALASLLHPLRLRLTTIATTDAYYRALFVQVDLSAELAAAYQQASRLFPGNSETAYRPHLSLVYGNFSPETRQAMIQEIGENVASTFEVDALHLYLTEGAVGEWQSIKAFPLRNEGKR
jgi:2'-5' RNA ligase